MDKNYRKDRKSLLSAIVFTLLSVFLSFPVDVPAQNADSRISGVVHDASGQPIMGAIIRVKDSDGKQGAISDHEGRFTLNVASGNVLQVECYGYADAESTIQNPSNPVRIVLEESSYGIDEVVVVGYGKQAKESVVGSISQVDNKSLVNSGTTNLTNALTGKLLGVNTTQTQGTPGDNNSEIRIRGLSSWNGSSPLVMVDGVERAMGDIDPNDVASISVLKDASATAVFGAKGANGVILVTTRTGTAGAPKMNLSMNYGIGIPYRVPETIDSYRTGLLANVAFMNTRNFGSLFSDRELEEYRNPSSRINELRYPNNNWYDLIMRNFSSNAEANFSVTGGTPWVRYYTSLGYTYEGPAVRKFNEWDNAVFSFNRVNFRSNLDFTVTKTTDLSIKVGGEIGVRQYPSHVSETSLWNMVTGTSPMMFPAYFPDWALDEIPDLDYPNDTGKRLSSSRQAYYGNPYAQLIFSDFTQTTRSKLYTDAIFNQKLDFITKGLSFSAKASLSNYYSRVSLESSKSIPNFYLDWNVFDSGLGNPWIRSTASTTVYEDSPLKVAQGGLTTSSYYTIFYWEAAFNYARSFGGKKHNVTALALYNQRERANQATFPYRNQGVAGRVTYDFKRTYLFEFNIGYTGSEQFAPENRFGLFPSIGLGYTLSNEPFWKRTMPWWSRMKFRYSDGLVGSDNASSRWLYYSSYSARGGYIYEDAMANLSARWETARKRDLGIEMGWFNNDLYLNVELFDEKRTDMLISPSVTMLVATSYKDVNRGEMKKHGIDIELGYSHAPSKNWRYEFVAMLGLNENRIVNYEDAPYAPDYQKYAGTPYYSQRNGTSTVDSGYYTSVDDIHNYPSYTTDWVELFPGTYKFLDYMVDGSLQSDDLHYIEGSQYAPAIYSLKCGLGFKGFEMSVLFYGQYGKYVVYNRSFGYEFIKNDLKVSKSHLNYWRPDNPDATHSSMYWGEAMYNWGGGTSDSGFELRLDEQLWRRADFLSLKEVYAGYTFSGKKFKQAVGINRLNVYLTANNLWTVTRLLEGNPEATTFSTGFYPMLTTIKLGVKIGF